MTERKKFTVRRQREGHDGGGLVGGRASIDEQNLVRDVARRDE